jgi:hypothetical protein
LPNFAPNLSWTRVNNITIQLAAQNPSQASSQLQVSAVLADAGKNQMPLLPSIVQAAGESFVEVADRQLGAWNVVTELVNYTSENTEWKTLLSKTAED